MSFYRQSPSRSPYRSPVRQIQTDRELIREQANFRRSIQAEVESRHMLDQISLLKLRLRKTEQVQDRCDTLLKQNSMLRQENDTLCKELSQRRYEAEKYRMVSLEMEEREGRRVGQLMEVNVGLEREVQGLRREREENNKIFQSNIMKLERMLADKIGQLQNLSIRYANLANQKQICEIRAEEQIAKLTTAVARNSHELEREYSYNRERQMTQNTLQVQSLKKNYTSQVMLLQDEVKKLSAGNLMKAREFESQLLQNRNLKSRHQQEIRGLIVQNDGLRQRMLKLQQINRSEVQRVQQKYSDHHSQDTNSLKEQYGREIKLLCEEIEKLRWLINEKNVQIQNLVKEKRDQRKNSQDRQMQFASIIDVLKDKLQMQENKNSKDNHALMERISTLSDKLLRESQNYHQRAKTFNKRIKDLQLQIGYKQGIIENIKNQAQLNNQQFIRVREDLQRGLDRKIQDFREIELHKKKVEEKAAQERETADREIERMGKQIQGLEVERDGMKDNIQRGNQGFNHTSAQLKREIEDLRTTIANLQSSLTIEQTNHSAQMNQLATKMSIRIQQLQKTQRQTIQQLKSSNDQQIETSNLRVQKCNREKEEMEEQLKKYIQMYEALQKYFANPQQGSSISQPKGQSNVYEVLSKVTRSSVHIF